MRFLTERRMLLAPFILALSLSVGCDAKPEAERQRPGTVPATAQWVGGADGGVYIHVSTGNSEVLTIYYEAGDVWYAGESPLSADELKQLSGWDGTTLYLKNGRSIQLLD